MTNKMMSVIGLLTLILIGCAIFIAWRLRRLQTQRENAEKRATVAFEEMNLLTKQLRDRGKAAPADAKLPPGERLQQMYPGAKRGTSGPADS